MRKATVRGAVEGAFHEMTSLSSALPLSAHRDSLQRYMRHIRFSFESVAGSIIAERLSAGYVREPVRPCLVLWACSANGGDVADALPVAAAFDLFDRFMLLHDELADVSAATIARWGLGQSLNAGDALYAVAFRSLASDVIDPANRLDAARLVGEAVLEAIEGSDGSTAGHCALTGAALRAGAILASAPPEVALDFGEAGRALGLAAQTKDAAQAEQLVRQSIALLQRRAPRDQLDVYAEVALDVARRAA